MNISRRKEISNLHRKVAAQNGKYRHCCEVFSKTIHGLDGLTKFVESCETLLLEKAGYCSEERNQKLQSSSFDIGGVKMVCILYPSFSGEGKGACKVEESTCWWSGWDKLPTPAGIDDEFTAKTLGMARRKESCDETWYSGKTDIVNGKLGHQDGLR